MDVKRMTGHALARSAQEGRLDPAKACIYLDFAPQTSGKNQEQNFPTGRPSYALSSFSITPSNGFGSVSEE
jgi:hypothetical protein